MQINKKNKEVTKEKEVTDRKGGYIQEEGGSD